MADAISTLAHNIRFLRKDKKMSQEDLAARLEIKRSNIAAYESKNVEPRLRIILEIARLFDVSVQALIAEKLRPESTYAAFEHESKPRQAHNHSLDLSKTDDIEEFIDKSMKIRKVLEGFKAFYNFKKNAISGTSPEKERIIFDIDNFIQLMEHLMTYNESVIKAITDNTVSRHRSQV